MELHLRDGILAPTPVAPTRFTPLKYPGGDTTAQNAQLNAQHKARHEHAQKVYDLSLSSRYLPMLLSAFCVSCRHETTLALYSGIGGPSLAIFPKGGYGLATPNAPASVAYYLDQASRAHAVGANSASVAMFRSALECLLFDQGYTVQMLGPKLGALASEIKAGTAKDWALRADPDLLKQIKNLGDTAVHPNDGDLSRQSVMDTELVRILQEVLSQLLDLVYEEPMRKASQRSALSKALSPLTKAE